MRFYILRIVVAVVAILMASGPVQAEWVDTFDNTVNDGFDQNWGFDKITAGGAGNFTATVAGPSGDGILQLQDTVAIAPLGGSVYGFGVVDEIFGSVLVSAVVNPNNESDLHQYMGLLGRLNPADLTGYALTVDYYADSGSIDLSRIDNVGGTPDVVNLAAGSVTGFASTDSLYIQLRVRNDKLIGSAYAYDSQNEVIGSLLGKIEAFDNNYAAGLAGVAVNVSTTSPEYFTPLRGTFDMVSASIPEPGSVVMLISGCLCALGLAWRRRQRQS